MPVGVAALPPDFRVLLWSYFRIKKRGNLSRFPLFSVRKPSHYFVDFPLDTANAAAYRGLRHIQRLLNFHDGVRLDAQIKNGAFLACKIAFGPEPLTFRLGKLSLDIQRASPLLLDLSPLWLALALLAHPRHDPCH